MDIISQLQGGLGNQLFQYATARALAHKNECRLLLDQGWFTKNYSGVTPRNLLLDSLNTKGVFVSFTPTIKQPKRLRLIFQKFLPITPYIYLEDRPYFFDSRLINSPPFQQQSLYLMGYWQSYRYFTAIREQLLEEICPKSELHPHYQHYLKKIKASNAAMVHIRRGDYINLPSAAKIHGFIGIDYYNEGMKILLDKYPKTHFFIFSDDLPWARENLIYQDCVTFVKSLDVADGVIQELELMTHCQNYLIANSSLSWWGAWLCKKRLSHVICPKRWANIGTQNWDDLLPANWHRI